MVGWLGTCNDTAWVLPCCGALFHSRAVDQVPADRDLEPTFLGDIVPQPVRAAVPLLHKVCSSDPKAEAFKAVVKCCLLYFRQSVRMGSIECSRVHSRWDLPAVSACS